MCYIILFPPELLFATDANCLLISIAPWVSTRLRKLSENTVEQTQDNPAEREMKKDT